VVVYKDPSMRIVSRSFRCPDFAENPSTHAVEHRGFVLARLVDEHLTPKKRGRPRKAS
jgi:hypothetical protein